MLTLLELSLTFYGTVVVDVVVSVDVDVVVGSRKLGEQNTVGVVWVCGDDGSGSARRLNVIVIVELLGRNKVVVVIVVVLFHHHLLHGICV